MTDQPTVEEQTGPGAGLPIWAKLLLLIIAAPLIAVLLPTTMLLCLGLIPTAAVYLQDKTREKSFTITVGLLNLCGVLPSIGELWSRGQAMQVATETVVDPLFWLMAFGAAAMGWLIFSGMPPLIAAYYTMASEARVRNVIQKQQALVEMWGEEVRGDAEPEGDASAPTTEADELR